MLKSKLKKWHIIHDYKPTGKIIRHFISGQFLDNDKLYYAQILECRHPGCTAWIVASKTKYTGTGLFT